MTVQSFTKELRRFSPMTAHIVTISLLIGVIALVPTFYNMTLYDQILTSGSVDGLWPFFAGAVLALAAEVGFRYLRGRQLSYFAARLDHFIGARIFRHLLDLPTGMTERASVSAQVARLRDFETVRDFFTGALAPLLFEMPLVFLYVGVMALVAPVLALVPLALIVSYAVTIAIGLSRFRETASEAAQTASKRQEFLLETMTKLRSLRLDGMEKAWRKRYAKISFHSSSLSMRTAWQAQNFESLSYALMTVAAAVTLILGVTQAIAQEITIGALVASMILIWRVAIPLQVCCSSISRLQQLSATSHQIKRLMALPPEAQIKENISTIPTLRGEIEFHRVSMRYDAEAEPALLGVSFKIKAGEVVAIRGLNGSGKSTLLKLIMGLYGPQSGCIRIDDVDIRQHDRRLLRQAIAYVPQKTDLFPGSIRENFALFAPSIDETMCWEALEKACVREEVAGLPQGIDTVIAGESAVNTSFLLKQKLNLARAYLRPASILLLDEASHAMGPEYDRAFRKMITEHRGRCTTLLVTHRDDHALLADQIFVFERGELIHVGKPRASVPRQQGRQS